MIVIFIHQRVFERRITKSRFGLVRVLYFVLRGRGRLPTQTWPFVNRICEPCVSVFDPPNYVVARLQSPVRVSAQAQLARHGVRVDRCRPYGHRARHRRGARETLASRPRRSYHITPR